VGSLTRIAFTADWHVDEYGSRVDPASGLNARLQDYLTTAAFVVDQAGSAGAAALVIAGDFTERRHPSPWLVARIVEVLDRSPELVLALKGNHDSAKAGRSIVDVLGGRFGVIGVSSPRIVEVGDVSIACMPFLDRHWLRAQPGFESVPDAEVFRVLGEQFIGIAAGLYAQAQRDHPGGACVLVCHQTLAGAQMSETQRAFLGDLGLVVDARALAAIGFEAVVAGHLHRHQVVIPGDRPVLYAGSIERVDFGEESEPKGFIVADVGPGRFEWQFIETPARQFVTMRDIGEVLSTEREDAHIKDAIVRVLDLDPAADVGVIRANLEAAGAFEITEIRRRSVEPTTTSAGMSEGLSAEQALEAYFDGDPDRAALIERGRAILAEVG